MRTTPASPLFARSLRSIVGVACALLAALAPSPARADATDDLITRAVTEYGLGRFDASRALLSKALTQATRATQKARAELYLGVNAAAQLDEKTAIKHFERALAHDAALEVSASAVKPAVLGLFRRVRARVTGRLAVAVAQPAAVVVVDGHVFGPTPQILRLRAGKHQVAVRLRGSDKTLFARTVNVAAGGTQHIEAKHGEIGRGALSLAVSPSSAHVLVDGRPASDGRVEVAAGRHHVTAWAPGHKQVTRTVDVAEHGTASLHIDLERDDSARGASPRSGRRIWTWVAGAGALVSLGVGIGFAVAAQRDYSLYQDNCIAGRASDARCLDLQRRIDDRDLAANVLVGVGVGLAAAGVALWFIEGALLHREREHAAGARFTPMIGQVNGGSLRITF